MTVQIVFAYILDLFVGDPRFLPHPVKAMGKAIEFLEWGLRKQQLNLYYSGIILVVIMAAGTFLLVGKVVSITIQIYPFLGNVVVVYFIYTALSVRDLDREAKEVYLALEVGNIALARKKLSRIVGRDTEKLDTDEIVRATVETVAENTVDGIISPLFYAFLGGAPLAMAFKAVSTLDSMVGYKNERYTTFGWASARLDDIANFIPARISAFVIPLASIILKGNGWTSFSTIIKDRKKSPSPNAGIPEAGFAGTLGITLGGRAFYNGIESLVPTMGQNTKPKEIRDIPGAIRLMYVASGITLVLGIIIRWYLFDRITG